MSACASPSDQDQPANNRRTRSGRRPRDARDRCGLVAVVVGSRVDRVDVVEHQGVALAAVNEGERRAVGDVVGRHPEAGAAAACEQVAVAVAGAGAVVGCGSSCSLTQGAARKRQRVSALISTSNGSSLSHGTSTESPPTTRSRSQTWPQPTVLTSTTQTLSRNAGREPGIVDLRGGNRAWMHTQPRHCTLHAVQRRRHPQTRTSR